MYKKITHNITEEHFDHPLATEMKSAMERPSTKHTNDVPLKWHDPLPLYVMNENTMSFRMDCRTAWAKWAWSLINYSISLNGNLAGTEQVKGRMHKNAVDIGDFLIPYYGLTASRSATTALIAIDDIGMHYVEAIKAKASVDALAKIAATWEPCITSIAAIFNELNPNNWPESLIADIFNNVIGGWKDQLAARAAGNLIADEMAIDYLNKVVVTGVPDHQKAGYSSLSDVFSRGIIAQFPSLFAD